MFDDGYLIAVQHEEDGDIYDLDEQPLESAVTGKRKPTVSLGQLLIRQKRHSTASSRI